MTDGPDWTGRLLRVEVAGPAHGGEFVARHEGRVVFCRGVVTGDVADVEVTDDRGGAFCRAVLREVVSPSPDRVDPACPAAAEGAGCCDWSHIDPEAALGLKGMVLTEQLSRIARVDAGEVTVARPADDALVGWRTVTRWVTDDSGRPGVRAARSCAVITSPCVQPAADLTVAVASRRWEPRTEILGVVDDDGTVHLASRPSVATTPGGGRRSASSRRARLARSAPWTVVDGSGPVVRRAAETRWELPVDAFWQAHRSAASHYAGIIADAAAVDPTRVWDLYGGAGLFAAAVLSAAPSAQVTVVEAAGSVEAVAGAFGPDGGVTAVRAPVERFLAGASGDAPDLVVLDPPRSGAGRPVMESVAATGARRVVHVGCDAASFARDVGVLASLGWTLARVQGVDAFPGTHHVEAVAVLDRPS